MKKIVLMMAAVLALSAGCKEKDQDVTMLYANGWQLKSIMVDKEQMTLPGDTPMLSFTDSSTVNGTGGCNYFFGSYDAKKDGHIKLSPLGMTRMMCPNVIFEEMYVSLLDGVDKFKVNKDSLVMMHSIRNAVLVYIPTTKPIGVVTGVSVADTVDVGISGDTVLMDESSSTTYDISE